MLNDDLAKTDELRRALIERATEYAELTGTPLATIGKLAVNDSAFFHDLAKGRNITFATHDRVAAWLHDNWPRRKRRRAG